MKMRINDIRASGTEFWKDLSDRSARLEFLKDLSDRSAGLEFLKDLSDRSARLEFLKDLFFPPVCPVCGEPIPLPRRAGHYRLLSLPGSQARPDSEHATVKSRSYFTSDLGPDNSESGNISLAPSLGELYESYICRECLSEFRYIDDNHCEKCGKQLITAPGDLPGRVKASGGDTRGSQHSQKGDFGARASLHSQKSAVRLCHDCRSKIRRFESCRCLITYDETAREMMADLKYNGHTEAADVFGVMAADILGEWIRSIRTDYIVPVPIHEKRLKKRGYNQAELIARRLAKNLTLPRRGTVVSDEEAEKPARAAFAEKTGKLARSAFAEGSVRPARPAFTEGSVRSVSPAFADSLAIPVRTDLLVRRKNTVAQKELGADERLANLQNAFEAPKSLKIQNNAGSKALEMQNNGTSNSVRSGGDRVHPDEGGGPVILLIDDIYTTGSTMEACSEALLAAGAGKVYGLCICAGEDAADVPEHCRSSITANQYI